MNVLEKILAEIEHEAMTNKEIGRKQCEGMARTMNIIRSHMGDIKMNEERWIPVEERFPEDNNEEFYDSVIVTLDSGRVAEGCYRSADKEWWIDAPDGHHFSENQTGHVVAWQPLPEPYKGE